VSQVPPVHLRPTCDTCGALQKGGPLTRQRALKARYLAGGTFLGRDHLRRLKKAPCRAVSNNLRCVPRTCDFQGKQGASSTPERAKRPTPLREVRTISVSFTPHQLPARPTRLQGRKHADPRHGHRVRGLPSNPEVARRKLEAALTAHPRRDGAICCEQCGHPFAPGEQGAIARGHSRRWWRLCLGCAATAEKQGAALPLGQFLFEPGTPPLPG